MPPRSIGAGSSPTPIDPLSRYWYYKKPYQDGELFASFDHLTVWDYTHVLSGGATEEDLTWARQMVNTFRPDLLEGEEVVKTTSLVWRRDAPPEIWQNGHGNFRNVLAGGGKCGPRSSWSVMVCQAFGIPAMGVKQPGHVFVHDSTDGGRQVYFQQQMASQWVDYELNVPAAGTYRLVMQAACINAAQELEVCIGDQVVATVPIELAFGLWRQSEPVELHLGRGVQTIRIQTLAERHMRGIALKSFELTPVKTGG